jgi:uncharacterized membrane protein
MPEVIQAKPSEAFFFLAWAYEECAEENDRNLAVTERWQRRSLLALAAAPLMGAAAASVVWALTTGWWPIPILLVLAAALVPSLWRGACDRLVGFRNVVRANRV